MAKQQALKLAPPKETVAVDSAAAAVGSSKKEKARAKKSSHTSSMFQRHVSNMASTS